MEENFDLNSVLPGQIRYDEAPKYEKKSNSKHARPKGQMNFDDFLQIKEEEKNENIINTQKEQLKNSKLKFHNTMENENLKNFEDEGEELIEEEPEIAAQAENDEAEVDASIQTAPARGQDGIIEKTISEVMHESMIPYTEHVVLDRALPRVEDGLKPVQRRILYSMLELGVTPDKQFRKSARIVGDCMGKYHPHGDSSVYDAMVRMSQDFSMSVPLVNGHGNFGSVDGDSAAAMRYTEAKLQPLAMELLRDLEKNTVRWSLNFDDSLKEPDMLPGRYPNLLVNGASGIAVGLATNIPPHNLGEVIDGTIAYIDNNKISLQEIMKFIKAPDFPTGGLITAGEECERAYATGKGKIIIRAKIHLENKSDKKELVITEIPYQVNKAVLLQKIVELKTNGKNPLSDISEIRDESDRSGMRAVIRLKKDANVKQILEYLYKSTSLQTSFAVNMVAIAGGKPRQMGLIEIISYYVEYQREVIFRRTKFDLDAAKDRAHIVEGLLIAINNIDEVIKIIKKSSSVVEARNRLRERFILSEKQANAILDMRLARLVNLEVSRLEAELLELGRIIKELTAVVNSKKLQFEIIKTELLEIKKKYGEDRKSEIIKSLEIKNLKECDESDSGKKVLFAVTAENLLKNINLKNYSMAQKEITDNSGKNDIHTILIQTKEDKTLLCFTNLGNAIKIQMNKVPESKWRDKGIELKKLEPKATKEEKIVSVFEIPENAEGMQVLFMTKCGMIKRSEFGDIIVNKGYYQVVKLKENDEVVNCEITEGSGSVVFVSSLGMTLNMNKTEIPVQGRISSGVIGISLEEKDEAICACQCMASESIVVLTDKGFAKRVALSEFEILPRNRKGLRIVNLADNGKKLLYAAKFSPNQSIAVQHIDSYAEIATSSMVEEARFTKGTQKVKSKILDVYKYNK